MARRWVAHGCHQFDVLKRFSGDGAPARIAHVPSALDGNAGFIVLDARPSFERSPLDNVWHAPRARVH